MKPTDTTRLLRRWRGGDETAFDDLFPRVYDELRSIAHHRLAAQGGGDTLLTTVLVHEAYLKLVDGDLSDVTDRAHFLAIASRAMRYILVDHARARSAKKRGGGRLDLALDELQVAAANHASDELIELTTFWGLSLGKEVVEPCTSPFPIALHGRYG